LVASHIALNALSPPTRSHSISFLQLLQKNALRPDDKVPNCPTFLPVTDTGVPDVQPQAVLEINKGKGFRTFACVGDKPMYSEYTARLGDITGNWWGDLYYDPSGFPTYNLTWQDPYDNWKQYPRDVITYKEFVEIPASNASDAPWARYKVMSDTGKPPLAYIERAETVGGGAPTSCENKDSVTVPMFAHYRLYACKEAAPTPPPGLPPNSSLPAAMRPPPAEPSEPPTMAPVEAPDAVIAEEPVAEPEPETETGTPSTAALASPPPQAATTSPTTASSSAFVSAARGLAVGVFISMVAAAAL
jgi:hypothetical protein